MTRPAGSRADARSGVQDLADWALSIRVEDISGVALTQSKLLLLDTIGCCFPALASETGQAVLETLASIGGQPQCSIIGTGRKARFPDAVLANGVLLRALDLNDYVVEPDGSIGGHPSDNIPVALAAGQLFRRTGRDVLAAIVLGYEVFGHFRRMMERRSPWDGVSASGVVAPLVAGRLMGLDRRQLASAIALSLSRAATSAVVRAGDISEAKSIANAFVAQHGIYSALLAQHGLTGPLAILEHPRGMKAIFPKLDPAAKLVVPERAHSYVMKAQVKTYPCVATAQGAVAAAVEMHRVLAGDVARLRRIRVVMPDYPNVREHQQDRDRAHPMSREASDHSLGFLVAVSLIDGALGPAQFENERWADPKVREVMDRLEFVIDPALARRAPLTYSCMLEAHDSEGGIRRVEVLSPSGIPGAGLDADLVIRKFLVAASHMEPSAAEQMVESVMCLDQPRSRLDFLDLCAVEGRS